VKNKFGYVGVLCFLMSTRLLLAQGTFTAIANGSWTSSSSWSHTGFDGDNIPDADDFVTIPTTLTITLPAGNQQVRSLTIQSGGTLDMNNSGAELDILVSGGLLQVDAGGTIADNNTNTVINFYNTSSFVVDGIVQVDFLEFEGAGQTVTITGSGTFLAGRININNINVTVTLNTTGSFGTNVSPLTIGQANFTISGTGTIGMGGAGNGDLNISASGATVGCTMTLSDDLAVIGNSSSLTIANGGSITVSDDLRVGPNADARNSTITVNSGGALTINSQILVDQTSNGTWGDNFTLSNSGTTSIVGTVSLNDAITTTFTNSNVFSLGANITGAPAANPATFTNNANATLSVGGDIDNDVTLTFSASGNTVNYTSTGGTDIEDPISNSYYNLIVGGASNRLLRDNIALGGDLTIQNSAKLNSNSRDITVAGNWTNSSSNGDPFVEGTRTVTFNGSADQTISTSLAAGESFYNLVVNKSAGGLRLATSPSTDISIVAAGTMTFTSGIVYTTSAESLTFNSTSLVSGGATNSYVDGPVRKFGTATFVFPTGNGSFWARIRTVTSSGDAATLFTAQYFASAFSDVSVDATLKRVSAMEYWSLSRTGTASNATVRLYWQDGARSGINSVAAADLRVARYNGSDWVDTGAGSVTGNTTAGTATSPSVASGNFTSFTFGSNIALPTNPLPIELLDFTAKLDVDHVRLDWSTASELNNDYFTVERTTDLEHFDAIATIKGHGTTVELNRYYAVDSYPAFGKSYYRLKQTDFDGGFSYSPVVAIDYDGPKFSSLRVYPNPSTGSILNVEIAGLKDQHAVPLQIFNLQGQKVFDQVVDISAPGMVSKELPFASPLPPGLYIVKAGQTLQLTQKIIVE